MRDLTRDSTNPKPHPSGPTQTHTEPPREHDHQLDVDPNACPFCNPVPYGPTLRNLADPSELREPPPPAAPRGPRLDHLGRRRARVHSVNKRRKRVKGSFFRTYRLRFPMLRLCGTWLHEAGFLPGRPITIEVEDGRLIIETAS